MGLTLLEAQELGSPVSADFEFRITKKKKNPQKEGPGNNGTRRLQRWYVRFSPAANGIQCRCRSLDTRTNFPPTHSEYWFLILACLGGISPVDVKIPRTIQNTQGPSPSTVLNEGEVRSTVVHTLNNPVLPRESQDVFRFFTYLHVSYTIPDDLRTLPPLVSKDCITLRSTPDIYSELCCNCVPTPNLLAP